MSFLHLQNVYFNFFEDDALYLITSFQKEAKLMEGAISIKDEKALMEIFEKVQGILEEKLVQVIVKYYDLFI